MLREGRGCSRARNLSSCLWHRTEAPCKSQHHCWGSCGCWPNTARGRNPGGRAPIRTRGLLRGGSHRPAHAQGLPTQKGLYPSAVPMLLMVPPSLCHKQIPVPQADPQIPPMDPHQAALRQRGSDTRGLGTEGRGLSRNTSPSSSSERERARQCLLQKRGVWEVCTLISLGIYKKTGLGAGSPVEKGG